MTEDETAGWHHQLDGHEFEWTPGVGLVCCDSWGPKELDMTEWLNWTELNWWCLKKKNSWKDKTMQYLLVEQILWGYEFLDFYFQDKHCVSHSVGTDSLQPHGLFATYQAPLSMEFSRKESWGWLLCHSTGDLSTPGIKLWSPEFQADSLLSEAQGKHIFRRIVYELMPLGYGKLGTN